MYFSRTFMNYRVLRKHTDSLATSFARMGVKKGDVIAILLPNCFQYTITYFATVKLGGIVIPINPTYKPIEILHVLEQVKPKGLVCMDVMYGLIKPIQEKYKFEFVISTCIVDLAAIPPAVKEQLIADGTIPKGEVPGAIEFLDVSQKRGEVDIPDVEIDPLNDTAVYLMTGGTTGVPKPAIITHYNAVTNAKQNVIWMPDAQHPMACVGILPMFHAFGMTIVQNVVIEGGDFNILYAKRELDLKEVVDMIVEVGPEGGVILPGVENLFIGLTRYLKENPEPKLANMFRLCVSGAGPLHKPVKDAFEAVTGGKLVEAYGLTESMLAAVITPLQGTYKNGSVGIPLPDVDVRVVDVNTDKGNLPAGEVGEIVVSAPQLMQGYWQRPAETAETIRGGWLYTGDIGYLDEDGYIFIVDRKKDVIKPSGFQVWPREVEEVIASHPAVIEVGVAGIPDERQGEAVKAWIVLRKDYTVSIDEIRNYCRENLTAYKVPKYVELCDSLPKSMVGKVLRRELVSESLKSKS